MYSDCSEDVVAALLRRSSSAAWYEAVGNTLLELLQYFLWSNKSSISIHVDSRWP